MRSHSKGGGNLSRAAGWGPGRSLGWFLVLLLVCLLPAAAGAAGTDAPKRTVRVVMDDSYPPYSFRAPDGTLQGILVDQWALWEKKTGVQVHLDAMDWAKAQRLMEAGDYDVIDTMFENPRRQAIYDFTRPYARLDTLLFFSRELSGIRGPEDLSGFVVGAKRGGNVLDILKARGVTNILLFDNYEAIVAAARDGRIKVFTTEKAPGLYYLIKMGIQDRFRASEPLYTGEFRRAVHKGDQAMLELVQRGFDAISPQEYAAIEKRWTGAPILTRDNLTLAGSIAAGALGFLSLLLLWVWALKRNVRLRTLELAGKVAELERTEQELRRSEEQNLALIRAVPDLIITYGRDGAYLSIHASEPSLLVGPLETLLHRNVTEVLPGPLADRFLEAIGKALDSKTVQEIRYPLAVAGKEHHFEARLAAYKADTVIAIVRDVSEHIRAEEARVNLEVRLQQTQRMESLGLLAGGVAHDMNNVLGAILSLASANQQARHPDGAVIAAFDTISRAAVRGGKMVKGLLALARQSPAEERELDLNGIVNEEVRLLERTTLAKVRLRLELEPGLRHMRGDASALAHAILNLCVNAVDAMSDSGVLTLRTLNAGEDWIEVQVEDTGTGMAPDVLDKALDPFFTTKEAGKGTGLGLPMVYSTVKAHQGRMDIASAPGRGTRVTLCFPACGEGAPAEPAAEPRAEAARAGLTVLLVDDDELIQSSLAQVLEVLGHNAVTARSGEEAIGRLEAGLDCDAVILDMNMPGLGGAGTLPRLRALRPRLPILLSTGRVEPAVLDLVRAHPFVTLLSKPFSMADLQEHLQRVGDHAGGSPDPAYPLP